jgi:hypothetical protein
MFKRGEVYENPVAGERAIMQVGTAENAGARLVVALYILPRAEPSQASTSIRAFTKWRKRFAD